MKQLLRPALLVLSAFALTLAPVSLQALTDAEATAGRALVKRFADTVVSVELVVTVKVTMGDRAMPPRENKVEINGTVISSTGLTVTALSAIDPRSQFEAMRVMQERNGQKMELGETEYKEVKLRLANGTEVPAVVVLKDADLDLAFVAPVPDPAVPATVFPFVKLEDAVSSELLGSFYSISRASKNLQRTPLVKASTVSGVVEKPRRMYLLSDQAIGAPTFDAAGHLLGVSAQYLSNGRASGLVVLPAADIAEVAKQAAAIKPEQVVTPAAVEPAAAPAKPATEVAPKS